MPGPMRGPASVLLSSQVGCSVGLMRVLFVSTPGVGRLFPMVPLAWALQSWVKRQNPERANVDPGGGP
jgi:hypothetical protein